MPEGHYLGMRLDIVDLSPLDVSSQWLSREEFVGADAAFAWVDETNFAESIFVNCDLSFIRGLGTRFTGAKFVGGTTLAGSVLPDVMLDGAWFDISTDLDEANLTGGSLRQIWLPNMNGTVLNDVSLHRSKGWQRFHHRMQAVNARIDSTEWNWSTLSRCNLSLVTADPSKPAQFGNSHLVHCRFNEASLRRSQFPNTVLTGCSFVGADLRGANFAGAEIIDCNFAGARVAGANFDGATLNGERI